MVIFFIIIIISSSSSSRSSSSSSVIIIIILFVACTFAEAAYKQVCGTLPWERNDYDSHTQFGQAPPRERCIGFFRCPLVRGPSHYKLICVNLALFSKMLI